MTIAFRSEIFDLQVLGSVSSEAAVEVLTEGALRLIGFLHVQFDSRRRALLAARRCKDALFDAGETPHFISDSSHPSKEPGWKCAPIPPDIEDRRVEITGPVDRKMVINGLNSGANVYMADFEDSTSPTWSNMIDGQKNLRDANRGTIEFTNPANGKQYKLNEKTAVLFVRPRGWHLDESHIIINGCPTSGSLVDFGLYFYHNAAVLVTKGTRPYFYLPKLESHKEAALWNDVFVASQQFLGFPVGTIRATVLIETITAAFEMEEILYELRDHSIGLNCGRWDYLFSFIKKFKHHTDKIAPDRSHLTMTTPLMQAYVQKLIYTCHRRGTFAMGGMSAAIPIRHDEDANSAAFKKVEEDKLREVQAGHDGTWVAHPDLVKVARGVFDQYMKTPNQINSSSGNAGSNVEEADLLRLPDIPAGEAITTAGLDKGIGIVLAYTEAWLRGVGCIPLHNSMEDAATAEISRVQIWQWRVHGISTQDDGGAITSARISSLIRDHVARHREARPEGSQWALAGKLVDDMLNRSTLDDFLTTVCYPHIVQTFD